MNRGAFQQMPFTPMVKRLMIINVVIWFVGQVIVEGYFLKTRVITDSLALFPQEVLLQGKLWQLVTYMFLHTEQVTHILFNMLMLWFFGAELEQRWGGRFFLTYYLVCGVGAAIIYVSLMTLAASFGWISMGSLGIPVIGASGAIFGLLLAYGMMFGERQIYFMMLFPMKAKMFVAIMGFVELASMFTSGSGKGSEVAYLAHLGGIASGYLFLKGWGSWQRRNWNRKVSQKHKGRNLRLVVDNEKDKEGPKYWN